MKQLSCFEDWIGQVCRHVRKVFIVLTFCETKEFFDYCQMGRCKRESGLESST